MKEIKDVQNKINNLMRLVADGLYNDDIKQKLDDLENDKTNLNVRLNRLKNISNNKSLDKKDIMKIINFDIDKLNSSDKLGLKNLLNKYINKIVVDYPSLEIYFKFSSSIDNTVKQAKRNERDNSFVCLAPLVGLEPTTWHLETSCFSPCFRKVLKHQFLRLLDFCFCCHWQRKTPKAVNSLASRL